MRYTSLWIGITLILTILTACNGVSNPQASSSQSSSSSKPSSGSSSSGSKSSSKTVYTNFAYVASTAGAVEQYLIDPNSGQMIQNPTSSGVSTGSGGVAQGTCQVKIHPNRKFVYASNCQNTTVAPFSLNSTDGTLSPLTGNVLTNPVSIGISSVYAHYMAFDSTGANLYVTAFKTTNAGSIADYLVQFSVNTSTGALSLVGTIVTNTTGNDLVGNYLTSHSLDTSNTTSASLGIHNYVINFSTGMVDQYDNGSLSAYSAYAAAVAESIVIY